jgi:hypothetical protein
MVGNRTQLLGRTECLLLPRSRCQAIYVNQLLVTLLLRVIVLSLNLLASWNTTPACSSLFLSDCQIALVSSLSFASDPHTAHCAIKMKKGAPETAALKGMCDDSIQISGLDNPGMDKKHLVHVEGKLLDVDSQFLAVILYLCTFEGPFQFG